MKVFGSNSALILAEKLDSDGDLSVDMYLEGTHIDKNDALEIVEHLKTVFGI